MIYLIKGKNGSGKTFLTNQLYPLGYNRSISCTTRLPRANEINGFDYYFVSKSEFERMIRENKLVEYQYVNGNYYGTPIQNLQDGVIIVSSDVNSLEKTFKGDIGIFFIDAPIETRYNRVLKRGTSQDEIFRRFTKENTSFLYPFKACFINNGNEEQALQELIKAFDDPKKEENTNFLYRVQKQFKPIVTNDELLMFLQFEEFLLRGIFLDKTIGKKDIDSIYFESLRSFLEKRNISFEIAEDGRYKIKLNGQLHFYEIDKNKIIKEGEKDEKKIS